MDSTKLTVHTVKNGIFPSNTYIVECSNEGPCVLIDPGLDTAAIEKVLEKTGAKPLAVLATHGHFDHIGSVKFFQERYGIPYYLHEADLKLSRAANFYLKMAKITPMIAIATPDHLFANDTDKIGVGPFSFEVYRYPGHSAGSCVFQLGNLLFSGDTIYKKGLGFNNFPGEDKDQLKSSILSIFKSFPADYYIYPGHGEPEQLEVIKSTNKELLAFIGLKENV